MYPIYVHMHLVTSGYLNITNRHFNFIYLCILIYIFMFMIIFKMTVRYYASPYLAESTEAELVEEGQTLCSAEAPLLCGV